MSKELVMSHLHEIYRCDGLPIFQNRMYATAGEARSCSRGDLRLVQNLDTGLIYNDAFDPALMVYDANYQNEQAVSHAFRQHLEEVTAIIARTMGREQLIEVGCGKGYFLEALVAQGFSITGFDPAYEGDNPLIRKEVFQPDVGMEAKGLVLRHVLEHIRQPVDFLASLAKANGGQGLIYIEVPCLDWIAAHRTWFDLFYEHVNYFRLADFARVFGRVVESGRVFGGQYLYVVGDLTTVRAPRRDPADTFRLPDDFLRALKPVAAGTDTAIWGAASKGVIFALMMERLGIDIPAVIDINPSKQGKFIPATGKRVLSPADALVRLSPGATIYVMNSNYLEEIRQMSNNAYNYVCIDNA